MTIGEILTVGAEVVSAIAMVVSCWLMSRAMKRSTELTNATEQRKQPLEVKVDEPLHGQFVSRTDFDKRVENNAQDHGDIWAEINELKRENLKLTEMFGNLTSRILADLANAQKLKSRE
ncbi:MAG TPA: hypothetical protein VGY56_10630 [Verrucomicrobiae bacterium]|nr:hypothetical protein [Verrucomicrobiae bacterium]